MTDREQKAIFSMNLNRLLESCGKTQKEVARAIGVSPQTFNTWCRGIALPRMGKVQLLADFFGVKKSDLIEVSKNGQIEDYYIDEETAKVAQEIFDDPDLRALFSAAKDAKPDDLKMAAEMLRRFKGAEEE